jgi:hypothetical protein
VLGLPNNDAWVDPLVFIALCRILIKIPSWVLRSIFGPGSAKLSRLAKTVIAYKTLGALNLKRGPGGIPMKRPGAPRRPSGPAGGPGRAARGGQGPGGSPGRPGRSPGFRQIPIPFSEGRRAMESRSTPGDHALARNALNRPDEPGTWLEEREAERRRRQRRGLPVEPSSGPRYRQEALFPRNAERITPPGRPSTTPPGAAGKATPGPASPRPAPAAPSTSLIPARPTTSSAPPTPAVGTPRGTAGTPPPAPVGTPRVAPTATSTPPAARTAPSAAPRAAAPSPRPTPLQARNSKP